MDFAFWRVMLQVRHAVLRSLTHQISYNAVLLWQRESRVSAHFNYHRRNFRSRCLRTWLTCHSYVNCSSLHVRSLAPFDQCAFWTLRGNCASWQPAWRTVIFDRLVNRLPTLLCFRWSWSIAGCERADSQGRAGAKGKVHVVDWLMRA